MVPSSAAKPTGDQGGLGHVLGTLRDPPISRSLRAAAKFTFRDHAKLHTWKWENLVLTKAAELWKASVLE